MHFTLSRRIPHLQLIKMEISPCVCLRLYPRLEYLERTHLHLSFANFPLYSIVVYAVTRNNNNVYCVLVLLNNNTHFNNIQLYFSNGPNTSLYYIKEVYFVYTLYKCTTFVFL